MPFFKQKDPTIPPGQSVAKRFPVLHVGEVPEIDPQTWRLKIYGLCEEPYELSFAELRALPSTEFRGDIHCVTRWTLKDSHWRGVSFKTLAELAKPLPEAKFVIQYAPGYSTNLPLETMLDDDVLIAYEFGGAALEPIHGGPVRTVVPKRYFWKSAKWIRAIEFAAEDAPGFWEKRGYHNEGDPWKEQRYAGIPKWFE